MRDPAKAFEVLLDLTRMLTERELDLQEALDDVTAAALLLFEGQHASLRVLDENGAQLRSGARKGAGKTDRPAEMKPGEGIAGWVVEHGEVARIDNAREDPRFQVIEGQSYSIGSLLSVPLWSAGKVLGTLSVTSASTHYFDEDDELIGRLLASCAAPPIERARLQRLAMTDPQTSALVHGFLRERLENEINAARIEGYPLSLLLMDLDHFKRVNDTHGHAAGDEVLVAFGELVRDLVRRNDVFVRRGGEEFILVMPRCGLRVAVAAAERIRASLAEHTITVSKGVRVDQRVSIGVALWNRQEDAATLEARADEAMYAAKHRGRDRVVSAEELPGRTGR